MARKTSEKYLKSLGVIVKTNVFVNDYDGKTITLNNGETIKTRRVIWAAGVTGNTVKGFDRKIIVQNGRMIVDRHNLVKDCSNIYAIGDIACMETPLYPKGHPQVANVAIHQARTLAKNLKSLLKNKPLREYEYRNMGSMATIGKNKAVVDLPFIRFQGYFAWFVWMFLHLMLILSIRNKLIVFFNWAINYFTKDTSLRLILTEKNEDK
jgi:NADH:ubiquinone reductase (H+-translocating)